MSFTPVLAEGLAVWAYFWLMLVCLEERLWAVAVRRPRLVLGHLCSPSLEWLAYHAVGCAVLGWWIPWGGGRVRDLCLRHRVCRSRLTPAATGWIDLSDKQWRDYRSAAPLVVLTCAASSIAGRITRRPWAARQLSACALVLAAHGCGAVYVLGLFGLFRLVSGSRVGTWLALIAALVAKEPVVADKMRRYLIDERLYFSGLYPWHAAFPLLSLRLASAGLDGGLRPSPTHAFYAPLYATGPVVCVRDFLERPRPVTSYALRTALAWVFLEAGTRRYPCFATARSPELLKSDPVAATAFVVIAVNLIFLKFAVIWRTATALARFDGVSPIEENMQRFVCDNFTVAGFWRDWHASFHAWLLRFVYLPLGGRRSKVLAPAAAFALAVAWHDALEPRLLVWGGFNLSLLLLERHVGIAACAARAARTDDATDRALAAARAAVYVAALLAANVVGFSAGLPSLGFLLGALPLAPPIFLVLFVAAQLAIRVRRIEKKFGR